MRTCAVAAKGREVHHKGACLMRARSKALEYRVMKGGQIDQQQHDSGTIERLVELLEENTHDPDEPRITIHH